jgi:nucleotide-binding universal stress UspA family protein
MNRIVVGFDAGEQGRDALRLAEVLRGSGDGELIVAAIDEIEPYFDDVVAWETLRQGYYASVFEAAADALGDEEFSPRGAAGSVPAELDRIAVAERTDAIIVGSTHRGRLGRGFRAASGTGCSTVRRARSASRRGATTSARIPPSRGSESATTVRTSPGRRSMPRCASRRSSTPACD